MTREEADSELVAQLQNRLGLSEVTAESLVSAIHDFVLALVEERLEENE